MCTVFLNKEHAQRRQTTEDDKKGWINMDFMFSVPSKVQYGRGCTAQIGGLLKGLGVKKILFVYDSGIYKAGLTKIVEEAVTEAGIQIISFDKVEPNPKDTTMAEGARIAAGENVDAIVAIGGGSSMDCAKGINVLTANPEPISLYEGFEKVPNKGKTLLCIPTTSGTSSELTNVSIVSDTLQDRKYIMAGKNVGADYALVDPDMMDGLPARVTAATGIDALTHAIESYVSLGATPLTKPLSMQAAKLICRNLKDAVNVKGCREAREQMALACVIVGCAFANAGNGLVHAISHTLGAHFHMDHGTACAVTLPSVIDFNYACAKDAYDELAEAMETGSGRKLSQIVYDLEQEIGIPRLGECGIPKEKLQFLAKETMKEDFGPNPNQDISPEAVLEILEKAW